MTTRVIVVGGGVTGLVAARRLRERGIAVTLIDRGFPFGGRLRPEVVELPGYGRAVFDPGPVVLGSGEYPADTADAPLRFPPVALSPALAAPVPANGHGQVIHAPVQHLGDSVAPEGEFPELLTTLQGGARALVDHLRPDRVDDHLELLTQTTVTALEADGRGWRVHTRHADGFCRTVAGDAVLLTQPVPDALALLDGSAVEFPDAIRDELSAVRYAPALALFAAYRGVGHLTPSGIVTFSDSPLVSLTDNRPLGISRVGPAISAMLDPTQATPHPGESDDEFALRLLHLLEPWVDGELVWHRLRRWTRFRAECRMRMPFAEALDVPPLVIAGDGFANYVENRLDAATTSATHAVTHLCRTLAREARIAARPLRRTPTPVAVEVCVTSGAEARTAVANGADRLLLCSVPEVGGVTPTVDALRLTRRAVAGGSRAVPVTVLIRPRSGGFGYSAAEFQQMRRDARRLLRAGAEEIAFGFLTVRDGEVRVDAERCEVLVKLAHEHGARAVFNRAFDCITDRRTGLQDLIALDFDRVYSSGGRRLALDGTSELTAATGYAGWEIEVVAAGGIGPEVARGIVGQTGCRQVLVGPRITHRDPTARERLLGAEYGTVNGTRVRATVAALRCPVQECEAEDDCADELMWGVLPRTAGV